MKRLLPILAILLWSSNAFSQPAFRSAAKASAGVAVDTTMSAPAGLTDGDLLLAAVNVTAGTTVTPPSGWTEYAGSPITWTTTAYDSHHYWKRAASEPGSWTWSHVSVLNWGAVCAYSGGLASGDPNDVTPTSNAGGSDTSAIALGVTVVTANSLGVIMQTNPVNSGAQTPPTGWTDHGFPNDTYGMEDKVLAAGATGDLTTTFSNSDTWVTFFVVLKPAAAAASSNRMTLLGVGP